MSKKFIKDLYGKTAGVLNESESLATKVATLLGIEEGDIDETVDALDFADYLQLGNAVDIGDVDEVRAMLGLDSEEPVTEAPVISNFNPKHIAQANKLALAQQRKRDQLDKKLAKQEWNRKYGVAAQKKKSKAEKLALDDMLLDKVENAIGNSFPDGDPMDWFSGFMHKHDLDLSDVDRVMKKRYGRTYDQYLIDMWDSYAADSAHDANLYISQGQDPGDSPFWSWDGTSSKVELEPNPWGSYPGSRWHKKGVNEADNPSVTPPSQGMASSSTINNKESNLVKRKEVDDLMFGDEVEVADVDGQPTAAKVIMPKGPGNTVVVKGKGGNEVILKKDSIIGTPKINEDTVRGWQIIDKSRVGGGADPTYQTSIHLRKGFLHLEVFEMFGDFWFIDHSEGGRHGALTAEQVDQYLAEYGAPSLDEIENYVESQRSYGDAENGPSPRDLMDSEDSDQQFEAQQQYDYHKREYDRLVKSQGWHGGASGTEVYNRDWKKEAAQHKREAAKYKKLAGINETASGGATGAGAIATAPVSSKPAPKSRKKSNVSRKKK